MNDIKNDILEIFDEVEFLQGKDHLLVGYAEMFGNECIPLYTGINYMPCKDSKEAIKKIEIVNPKARTADGFDKFLIGHLKLESGEIILLYNKSDIISQLAKDFSEDTNGVFEGPDDCYSGALEYYEFNIIGAYMDGIPAFAVLYSK